METRHVSEDEPDTSSLTRRVSIKMLPQTKSLGPMEIAARGKYIATNHVAIFWEVEAPAETNILDRHQ